MKCPNCAYENSRVLDSRGTDENNSIRRRRECINCGKRYTTYEKIETTPILVIKNDGSRQPFDATKIKKGLIKSCEKRPVSLRQIDQIANDIEKELSNNLVQEIESKQIGDMVMKKLKEIDEISYVRFACVYRKFTDITNLKEFINRI